MRQNHATPSSFDNGDAAARDNLWRSIVAPIAGAVTLVVMFFILLLSSPGARSDDPAPADPGGLASAAPAAAPAPVHSASPTCPVPEASGKAGVVARRFQGKKTSSGHRYDASESSCIVNAAGPLGEVPYGTSMALVRGDQPERRSTCTVVGRWNGERFPDRLVLVSSAVAADLEVGEKGLVEVASRCDATATAQVADSRPRGRS